MRILIKGGVWKNTEDEILKAAVMKYGKNQWARVASLINRKSAKQCKARWYEWLDPSIKKTEWSREEEEKLLHLAKLMPNQWRTIAPIVGRTAGQCMEHYERLLDQAQAEDDEEGGENATEEARRLRPGEIDPTPETKPARPDPIDMDDDDKEMLSEARARLANTKGKKAKRKARERMLEESRRLALLQKRRELKAAGIESRLGGSKKKNFVDYAREIPFQKLAPVGFYDVSEENEQAKRLELDPKKHGLELQKLEGQHEKDEQERQEQRDKKLMKELFKANAPLAVQKITEQTDPVSLRRRLPLDLPAPQVTDNDLEEIVKLGKAGAMGPPEGLPSRFSATSALVNDYSQVFKPPATPLRTPQQEDFIMQEARNLRALSKMTPLMMQEANVEDLPDLSSGTGFDGIAPRKHSSATPNPLVANTPSRQGVNSSGSVMGGLSVLSTPLGRGGRVGGPSSTMSVAGGGGSGGSVVIRDSFGLNQSSHASDDAFSVSDMSSVITHSRLDKHRSKLAQQSILAQLSSLPEPEYTYDVALPSAMDEDGDDGADVYDAESQLRRAGKPEDRADVEARQQRERLAAEEAELQRRSTVLKRSLPRPATAPALLLAGGDGSASSAAAAEKPASKRARTSEASSAASVSAEQKLVQEEMFHLIAFEDRKYPASFTTGQVLSSATTQPATVPLRFRREPERFADKDLQHAAGLIRGEAMAQLDGLDLSAAVAAIAAAQRSLLFVPSDVGNAATGRWVWKASEAEQLKAAKTEYQYLAQQFEDNRTTIARGHEHLQRLRSKSVQQQTQLRANLAQRQEDFQRHRSDLDNVQTVRETEQRAAQMRLDRALEEALQAEALEKESQRRYADLVAYARNHGVAL